MSKRREGREAAMQYLFQSELQNDWQTDYRAEFWKIREASRGARDFAENLINGVCNNITNLDERITRVLQNFILSRLNAVDRNILRVAVYEMFHCLETPPIVAINEAVECAKKYGGEESGRFVNGVLDRLKSELDRPLRTAAKQN